MIEYVGQSVVDAVEQELERLIVSGEIAPGQHINENALATRLKVSRAPVREACRLLERVGLVTIVPNQGAFVRAPSLPEIVNLFDIRASLGRLAGREAAVSIIGEQLDGLRSLIEAMDAAAEERSAERYTALNLEFHACLYAATGNARLAALDASIGKELRIYRRHGLAFGGGLAVSNREHRNLLAAIERGDCAAAAEELERHIQNGRDRFLRAMAATGQLVLQGAAERKSKRSVTKEA